MYSRRGTLLLLSLMMVVSAGCGGEGRPLTPVHGKVLYNEKPLQFGSITFQPPGGQPATAMIGPDGTFELITRGEGEGAVPGMNKVRVVCYEGQSPKAKKNGKGETTLGESLIPKRYTSYDTSGLTVDVQPDHTEPVIIRLTK